jgi:hypothetical protein
LLLGKQEALFRSVTQENVGVIVGVRASWKYILIRREICGLQFLISLCSTTNVKPQMREALRKQCIIE